MKLTTPPLNALRVFDAVARHLNMTRAAEALHVSQSAASQQLKLLEQYLETQLIDRSGGQIQLTEMGQAYSTKIKHAFDEIRHSTYDLKNACLKDKRITINVPTAFATRWLFRRLSDFQHRYPNYQLVISTPFRLIDFHHDDVDAAVYYGDGQWDEVNVIPLMEDDIVPVCSPQLLAEVKQQYGEVRIDQFPLLLTKHVSSRLFWSTWFEAVDCCEEPKEPRYIQLLQLDQTLEAAINGLGMALTLRTLVKDEIAEGKLVTPINVSVPSEDSFHFVYPPEKADCKKVIILRDWFLEHLKH